MHKTYAQKSIYVFVLAKDKRIWTLHWENGSQVDIIMVEACSEIVDIEADDSLLPGLL